MTNRDKQKIPVTSTSTGPELQNDITAALLQNGGIKRIQDVLKQRLDEAGWSQDVRQYADKLFRSGEATTFNEAMVKIKHQIASGSPSGSAAGDGAAPDLRIPKSAREGGAEVVKKELAKILDMKK